jgi:large subunit ribosomal protein L25
MEKHILKAEKRDTLGRKVKHLRSEGFIPANIFGKKVKSLSVKVSLEKFKEVYKEAGETGVVELDLDGKEKRPVLIHNVQVGPLNGNILHIDFLQVDLKEKVTAEVPVELIGESPAEKQGLGTVVTQVNEIEVEALPQDLPEKFEVDLSVLTEVDQSIFIKDIKVDAAKVTILDNLDDIVVKVEPLQKVEEITPVTTEVPAEGEAAVPEAGAPTETGTESTEAPKE